MAYANPAMPAVVGLHPHLVSDFNSHNMGLLEDLSDHPQVVAIGEIGLDYYRSADDRPEQLSLLKTMLELAACRNLPVILHCRSAEEDMRSVIRQWARETPACRGKWRGVRHCFGGDLSTARFYLEMGFMLSFGAYIGYPSAAGLADVINRLPEEALLVETDCPYLPPQRYRGKRNEPSYLPYTANILAEVRNSTPEDIARITSTNACLLFGLDRPVRPDR
jgi:TatD DNase family protein